jgi:hypothetical protein
MADAPVVSGVVHLRVNGTAAVPKAWSRSAVVPVPPVQAGRLDKWRRDPAQR